MKLLQESETVLATSGFRTQLSEWSENVLLFEDPVLLGFVSVFSSVSALLNQWQAAQDTFLRVHAKRLRRDPVKAWNIYAVLLTEEGPTSSEIASLLGIEENLTATRKIARAGTSTKAGLLSALAPLLPLRAIVKDSFNLDAQLQARLTSDEREVFEMLQRQDFSPTDTAAWLLRGKP